jgi:WD40 repeat protein/energy-coupling factor transporter ATP-binding protein EcfA2
VSSEHASAFSSLAQMREFHSELLLRRREAGIGATIKSDQRRADVSATQLTSQISTFLERGVQAGALLDSEDDRIAAQSLLTYWANILQRLDVAVEESMLADFDPELAPELPDKVCPYLGLDAFSELDHPRFFGRQPMVDDLVARLAQGRLVLIVGPSGSGKSSLVRAGLIPALRGGALPDSANWRYLEPLVPGAEPLTALAQTLNPALRQFEVYPHAHALREQPAAAPAMLGADDARPCLLLIDQFEELFTLVEHESERLAFTAALLALAEVPAPAHRIVLTMRSDFEPFVATIPELSACLEGTKVTMVPLGAAELRQVIEAPAQTVGLRFEPGVVDLLVQDIAGEPAGLPLLQFTLLKLWERRARNRITLAAYEQVGGGRQALARSADALYDALIPEEQVTLRRLLLRMVRPGEGLEVTSNRMRLDTLSAFGEDPGRIRRVLQKLIEARLLRLSSGESQNTGYVEVAHEALVRNWPRLVGWLEDEKLALATRRRLELLVQEWQRLGAAGAGLLDATQLFDAERWVASPEAAYLGYDPALNQLIFASNEALRRQEAEREAARERELAQARALAAEQQARAEAQGVSLRLEQRNRNILRVLSLVLAVLAISAIYMATLTSQLAQSESNLRQTAEVAATANAGLASTEEALRREADQRAQLESGLRATAEVAGTAEALRAAELAVASAQARARELAALSTAALAGEPQLALLLAVAAVNTTQPPDSVAISALQSAVSSTSGEGLLNHVGPLSGVVVSADGALLATGAPDGVRLWTPDGPGATPVLLADLGEPVRLLALSNDGRWLAIAGVRSLLLYALTGSAPADQPRLLGDDLDLVNLAFGPTEPDGVWLIAAGRGGELRGWQIGDAGTGPPTSFSDAQRTMQRARALAFTPDGAFFLSGGDDRLVRLWSLRAPVGTSRLAGILSPRRQPVTALAVSPDGRWLASGAGDGSVDLWRLGPSGFVGNAPTVKGGHQGAISALAFSPDARLLLSGSSDRNSRLWQMDDLSAEAVVLTGHSRPIRLVGFSPNSALAFSGSADRELLVWRLNAPADAALRLRGHDAAVTSALVADGRLFSVGEDGQLRRWPLPPAQPEVRAAMVAELPLDQLKTLACRIAGRGLRPEELLRFFNGDPANAPTCTGQGI